MKLTLLSFLIYFFASTIIFYTFFIVIQIMKNKYCLECKSLKYHNLTPEEALLGTVNIESSNSDMISGFCGSSTRTNITLPLELIVNGLIIYENLNAIKKDYQWLNRVLNRKGVRDIRDVSYGVLDINGKISFTITKH